MFKFLYYAWNFLAFKLFLLMKTLRAGKIKMSSFNLYFTAVISFSERVNCMKHPTYHNNQPGALCILTKFVRSIFLAAVAPRRCLLLQWETLPNNENKRGKRKSRWRPLPF